MTTCSYTAFSCHSTLTTVVRAAEPLSRVWDHLHNNNSRSAMCTADSLFNCTHCKNVKWSFHCSMTESFFLQVALLAVLSKSCSISQAGKIPSENSKQHTRCSAAWPPHPLLSLNEVLLGWSSCHANATGKVCLLRGHVWIHTYTHTQTHSVTLLIQRLF